VASLERASREKKGVPAMGTQRCSTASTRCTMPTSTRSIRQREPHRLERQYRAFRRGDCDARPRLSAQHAFTAVGAEKRLSAAQSAGSVDSPGQRISFSDRLRRASVACATHVRPSRAALCACPISAEFPPHCSRLASPGVKFYPVDRRSTTTSASIEPTNSSDDIAETPDK